MTPIETLLRGSVFDAVKISFNRKIELTSEKKIVEESESVITTLQGENDYPTIDINWDNFIIVPGKERDEVIPLDNELLSQGYRPSEGSITAKVLTFSSSVIKGDGRLLKVIEDNLRPNRRDIYSVAFEGDTVSFEIVTIGRQSAPDIAALRNRAVAKLKGIVAEVNAEIPRFKKELDELISKHVIALKAQYQSRNNLYDDINKIK